MTTGAFILMVTVQLTVTIITAYFFWKVLKSPLKPEPDSYEDNDNDPR
jgi:heme/copper-type cytochrome/quinol oxidase subunit 2